MGLLERNRRGAVRLTRSDGGKGLHSRLRIGRDVRVAILGLAVPAALAPIQPARSETISQALSLAYERNPSLNEQRAGVRADDEQVSSAKSGYRPQVSGSGQFGPSHLELDTVLQSENVSIRSGALARQASVSVTQTLFDGDKTTNKVRMAESQVLASREQLRLTELDTLQTGATAYMDVLRDTAIVELDLNNIVVLEEQLRQTRDRFLQLEVTPNRRRASGGEPRVGTRRHELGEGQSQVEHGDLRADDRRQPRRLEAARPVDRLLPVTLDAALVVATAEHPDIQSALHSVDSAQSQVEVAEADLYPTLSVNGQALSARDVYGLTQTKLLSASVTGQLNVPLYSGGETFSAVRRAKEQLAQARLHVDTERLSVRSNVVSSWAQFETTKEKIHSIQHRSAPTRSPSRASASKRASASVRRSTCCRRSKPCCRRASISSRRSATASSTAIACWPVLANCRPQPSASPSSPTIRRYISIRSKTFGSACARLMVGDQPPRRSVEEGWTRRRARGSLSRC